MEAAARSRTCYRRLWRWLFRRAERRTILGVSVGVPGPRREREPMFEKITAALELLRQHDARRLDWLHQYADGVFVFGTTGALAEWVSSARLVVLEESYVRDPRTSAAAIASTLVHEATHARLDRLGLRYTPDRRVRIEAICFRSELAFARRLPEPGNLIAEAERQLTRDPAYWTDEAFRQRMISEGQKLGIPHWLLRILDWASARRQQKGKSRKAAEP
jgi:hypothetical protein